MKTAIPFLLIGFSYFCARHGALTSFVSVRTWCLVFGAFSALGGLLTLASLIHSKYEREGL